MQNSEPVTDWLNKLNFGLANEEQKRSTYRNAIQTFAAFSGKPAPEIIPEHSKATEQEFKNNYTKLYLAYIAHLQKSFPPNNVREQIDIIRSFFRFHNLPTESGVRAIFQFFFK